MKITVGLAILAITLVYARPECEIPYDSYVPEKWKTMEPQCFGEIRRHIQMEIEASYNYLEMAAFFSRYTVNRPGFAEFFFSAATEKRKQAIKLLEYLSMRGELAMDVNSLITSPAGGKERRLSGVSALKETLEMETMITQGIVKIITVCESTRSSDYHVIKYLTSVYLDKQLKDQRKIAGKLTTLKKMEKAQGDLGEFLLDKEI